MKVKFTKNNSLILIAALTALVGMIIYAITSTTGYLAVSAVNPWPFICTIVSLAVLLLAAFSQEKLTPVMTDLLAVLGFVMLLISFYFFVMSRVSLAADIYFIPVNYPESEETALNISIVGVVFYLIAIIALIVAAFKKKENS